MKVHGWEVVKTDHFWRFVNHEKRLLTAGWRNPENMDFSLIRIDETTIKLMLERYKYYFG